MAFPRVLYFFSLQQVLAKLSLKQSFSFLFFHNASQSKGFLMLQVEVFSFHDCDLQVKVFSLSC